MFLVIGAMLIVYTLLNYYIGIRGLELVGIFTKDINRVIYWVIFYLFAFSYIVSKLLDRYMPSKISSVFNYLGSYYMAILLYSILIIIIVDVFRLVNWKFNILGVNDTFKTYMGVIIVCIFAFVLLYGTWSGSSTVISKYTLKVDKKAGEMKNLNIIMASDIHVGSVGYRNRMEKLVELTNSVKPDIVLLAGDIIDDRVEPFIEGNVGEYFKQINAPLGIYAVTGNHEYISGKADEFVKILEENNVKVLRDDHIEINGSFYVIGRNDISSGSYYGEDRKDLEDITKDLNKELPILIMDHQPKTLQEAVEAGVDLQVSGHTHRGQMSPSNIVTNRLFEIDWGYLKKENLNVIVSSGFGTWGPPIRIGSRSELVNIILEFK